MSPTAETFGQLFDGILSFFNKNFSDSVVFYNFVANVLGYLRQSFFKTCSPRDYGEVVFGMWLVNTSVLNNSVSVLYININIYMYGFIDEM